jgi:hypothetical protein
MMSVKRINKKWVCKTHNSVFETYDFKDVIRHLELML